MPMNPYDWYNMMGGGYDPDMFSPASGTGMTPGSASLNQNDVNSIYSVDPFPLNQSVPDYTGGSQGSDAMTFGGYHPPFFQGPVYQGGVDQQPSGGPSLPADDTQVFTPTYFNPGGGPMGAGYDPYAGASDPLMGGGGDTSGGGVGAGLPTSGLGPGMPGYPDPNDPGLANIPGVTFNAPGTGPSDVGNGPLYYDPVTKSWLSKAASAVKGIPGSIGNAFRGIAGSVSHALDPNVGHYSPEYLASIGYEPGAGRGSQWPGAGPTTTSYDIGAYGAGGQGGSFFHGNTGAGPLAGSFAGLGGGWTQGVTGMIPFWQREEMRRAHATMRRGYRSPLIGTGDAVAQFAANLGSHPRYQGAYSPAAAMAAMAAVGGGTQQAGGGGGGMPEDRAARGPGGRSMSPV